MDDREATEAPPPGPVSLDELLAAMRRQGWTVAHADDVARERTQAKERS